MSFLRFLLAIGCVLLVEVASVEAQAPEQDCINAINLCSPTYSQGNAYAGIGQVVDVPPGSSCLQGGETNSVWYTFTVAQSGLLSFQLTPVNQQDDYDFALYLLGDEGCASIAAGSQSPLRCNYSSTVGNTGISAGFSGVSEGSSGPNQCAPLEVEDGQTYALLVSNFTASQGGYSLDFEGSAVIGDQVAAAVDSLDMRRSCNPQRIDLWLDDPVLCSSIAGDGSEITITGPSAVSVNLVTSALSCAQGQGYTTRIRIMLEDPVMVFGTYTVTIGNGSDGDTWVDGCGNALAVGTSLSFTVSESGPQVSVQNIVASYCGQDNGSAESLVTGGTEPYAFLWNSTPSQTTANATGLIPGNYYVRVTDANGCREIVTFTIPNNSPLTLTTSLVSAVSCNGGSDGAATVNVSGGEPPYAYSWNSNPIQTTQTATGLPAGNRIVTVTDNTGCVATATRNVTQPAAINVSVEPQLPDCGVSNGALTASATGGTGGYSFEWATQPAQLTPGITDLFAGIYQLTVTDQNGCVNAQQVNLINSFAPDAGITSSTPDCGGQLTGSATVETSSGQPPFEYQWSTQPPQNTQTASGLSQGDYFVIVTDQTGCIQIVNVKIDSISPPQIQMDVTASGCGLDDGQALANVTEGLAPYTFNWDEFPNQDGNSLESLAPGLYGVTVTDAIGCVSDHEFVVEMLPPESSIDFENACLGQEVQLSVVTNSSAIDFSWYLDDGTVLSGDSVAYGFSSAGAQEVLLILQGGCMDDTVQATVDVWPLPTAAFEYGPEVPTSRTPVDFVYTGSPAQDWLWDFGNGQTSSDSDPSLVFGLEGEYRVTLTVTDSNGCVDTTAQVLDLLAEPILVLPSAFVPEGVNQLWHGKGLGVEQVEIHVFARSGEELWSCVGAEECLDTGWDGTFNGSPLPQGAYAYRVDATFHNAKSWQSVGTVTLLR